MSLAVSLLIAIIFFVTHTLGAVAAYGSALLALPLLYLVTGDLAGTVVLLALVGLLQSAYLLTKTHRFVDYRRARSMAIGGGIGVLIGWLLSGVLPEALLLALLALVLIGSGLHRLWTLEFTAGTKTLPRLALRGVLLLAGVLHGAFASGGGALVVYASHRLEEKQAFRGTLCLVWIVLNAGVLALRAPGTPVPIGPELLVFSLSLVFAGTVIGNRIAFRMPQATFTRFVSWLLVFSGLVLVVRALLPYVG